MTKGNVNVLMGLLQEIAVIQPDIRYSPMQNGDTLIGQASTLTLKLATFANRIERDLKLAQLRLDFEPCNARREQLLAEIMSLGTKLSIAMPLLETQLRTDVDNWGEKLTIRDGSNVVVTEVNAELTERSRAQIFSMMDAQIERRFAGDPATDGGFDVFGGAFNLDELVPGLSEALSGAMRRRTSQAA